MVENRNHQRESEPLSRPLVLAADTTTPSLSLALLAGEDPLAVLVAKRTEPHSRRFFERLNQLLQLAEVEIDEVDLFAVTTGPGSFTGLRVAIAALQGLAFPARKPVYGIDSLDLSALGVRISHPLLILLEAGRGEIYAGWRALHPSGELTRAGEDRYGDPQRILPLIFEEGWPWEGSSPRQLGIVGSAAERCLPFLIPIAAQQATTCHSFPIPAPTLEGWQVWPDTETGALFLARHARYLAINHQPPICHPRYIRPSDAELLWQPPSSS